MVSVLLHSKPHFTVGIGAVIAGTDGKHSRVPGPTCASKTVELPTLKRS